MNKFPCVSKETAKLNKDKKRIRTISQIPYDRYYCACRPLIDDYFKDISAGKKVGQLTCPRKDYGAKKYEIICNNCGSVVAICWTTDPTMEDFYDLHYVCEQDGKNWYGAMALNLSPINGKLGIECSCGQDTRDFRANNTLPPKEKESKIMENSIGSDFGKSDSKFRLKEIK